MQTKFRFIEGYQGNDTVRGWREYDSLYHAVFACMRGTHGYPKGRAYDTVPEGLLLRPAIPSEEIFGVESTYGPRANFKISLRELPDEGRFRATVTAAKYNDGLLLDDGTAARPSIGEGQPAAGQVVWSQAGGSAPVPISAAGVYQVDLHKGSSGDDEPEKPQELTLGCMAQRLRRKNPGAEPTSLPQLSPATIDCGCASLCTLCGKERL